VRESRFFVLRGLCARGDCSATFACCDVLRERKSLCRAAGQTTEAVGAACGAGRAETGRQRRSIRSVRSRRCWVLLGGSWLSTVGDHSDAKQQVVIVRIGGNSLQLDGFRVYSLFYLVWRRTPCAWKRRDEGGESGGLYGLERVISRLEDWSSRSEKSENRDTGPIRVVCRGSSKRSMIRGPLVPIRLLPGH
jgi:hypothetical protein